VGIPHISEEDLFFPDAPGAGVSPPSQGEH